MVLFFATLGRSGDIALCYTQDHILDVSLEVHNSRIIMSGLLHIAWPCNLCCAYKHRSAGARARAQGGRALGPPMLWVVRARRTQQGAHHFGLNPFFFTLFYSIEFSCFSSRSM